jgi:hypothetical protein
MLGYEMTAYRTLSEAGAFVRQLPQRTIWAVVGLDGGRYYAFCSRANSAVTPDSIATVKLTAADQIRALGAHSGGGILRPSQVGRLAQAAVPGANPSATPDLHGKLTGLIQDAMFNRGVTPGAHAEEFVIAGWNECVSDYKRQRGKAPVKVEIFLSFSPCREGDPLPSPPRTINGTDYPCSCRNKLYKFFEKNRSIRWSVNYNLRFRSAEAFSDDAMPGMFAGWTIRRMSQAERAALGLD